MTVVTHYIENGIHFLVFPSHITQDEYDDTFNEAHTMAGDLTRIKLILDLSLMDYINSGFIGIVAEFFSLVEEKEGQMVIIANSAIDETFWFVGFKDFVDIVLTKEGALDLLK